jgi:hypothetical protein
LILILCSLLLFLLLFDYLKFLFNSAVPIYEYRDAVRYPMRNEGGHEGWNETVCSVGDLLTIEDDVKLKKGSLNHRMQSLRPQAKVAPGALNSHLLC